MTFVRVKLPNGDEATIGERAVEVFGATVIDKPAVDGNGRPLAVKPNIHKGGALSLSKSSPRDDLEKHAVEVLGMSADDVSAYPNKSDLYDAIEQAVPATTNQES